MRNVAILLVAASLAACGHDGANLAEGEKPAAHAPAVNPHAGVDPHARVNPHAGVDPHSRVDPHAGMTPPAPAAAAPIAWTVPDGWKGGAPSTRGMRVATFDVGADATGDAVQCVVYRGIAGTDEQNFSRWIDQMGGTAKGAKTTHVDHDGLKITRLEVRGAYTDPMRAGDPKTIDPGTMLAAIVDGPAGKLHVKFAGASSVVDAAAAKFDAFLASMKAK